MNRLKLAITALVTTGLFMGLAILGWNGPSQFFSKPPFVSLTLATLSMLIVALLSPANLDTGIEEDRANRWVVFAFAVIGLALAWLPAYTDRHDLWTFGGSWLRWIGVGLYTLGGLLRLWPVFVLGRRFSGFVAIQRDHELVTTGIYRFVRHPSYLGVIVMVVGWSLAFRSGAGLALSVLILVPLFARIRSEEAMLEKQFGDEYRSYRGRTWRLLPGIY